MGNTLFEYNQMVISDSGAPLLALKSEIVRAFAKLAKATLNATLELYTIPCEAVYDNIAVVINGHQLNITSDALTVKADGFVKGGLDNNTCIFAMQEHEGDQMMGPVFMRQFCHVHDLGNSEMGFAPVKK
uniref:Peptidase A1 domain-containing protein n=1 Tax=Ditylenchus dipsaci TaxID=166011 RepID=A0A915CPP9_9BILA